MLINFWYAAASSDSVTDQPVKVRMLGQDFVLFRDAAGTVACLADTCVHRGASLGNGKVMRQRVAFAIPSPARREGGSWVLDAIPLLPAEGRSASTWADSSASSQSS